MQTEQLTHRQLALKMIAAGSIMEDQSRECIVDMLCVSLLMYFGDLELSPADKDRIVKRLCELLADERSAMAGRSLKN